jgi:hypothetical protein
LIIQPKKNREFSTEEICGEEGGFAWQ